MDAQQVGEEAQRFVQGLVDAFGFERHGHRSTRDGDEIEVSVDGTDLGLLVGPRGATLQAVQEIARVGGAAPARAITTHGCASTSVATGSGAGRRSVASRRRSRVTWSRPDRPRRLEPMSSADRKVIHDVLSEVDGVVTRSEGEEPNRRVVVTPPPDA